jgi:hypothetical protein
MKLEIPSELKLNGTDNDGIRHRYSFDKTPKLREGLKDLLLKLNFEEKKLDQFLGKIFFRTETNEKSGEEQEIILEPNQIIDRIFYISNKIYEVDLFFGSEKIILVIRTKEDRTKLVNKIESKSKWISEEEKKKRLENNKKLKQPIHAK